MKTKSITTVFSVWILSILVGASGWAEEKNKEGSLLDNYEFFGIQRDNGYTQAALGSVESTIGAILAYKALKGPKFSKQLPTNTLSSLTNAENAIKNAQNNLQTLKDFRKVRGLGVVKGIYLIGSAVFFVGAGERVYQWYGTDNEPTWSPLLTHLFKTKKLDLKEVAEKKTTGESMEEARRQSDELRAALQERLNSRTAKTHPSLRQGWEQELKELDKQDAHRVQAEHDAQGKVAPFTSQDYFKTRPTGDQKDTLQEALFGGDLLASYLLVTRLLTQDGAKQVRQAEKSLAKLKQVKDLGSGTNASVLAEEYAMEAAELEGKIAGAKAAQKFKEAADFSVRAKELREAEKLLRSGKGLAAGTKAKLVESLEKSLADLRVQALKTSKAGALLKVVGVLGTTVLLGDGIGRVYEWYIDEPNPKFSPALTWLSVKAKQPMEKLVQIAEPYVQKGEGYFKEHYRRFAK